MNGIELIAKERQRQIDVEGWTPAHDAEHSNEELSKAAACYALPESVRFYVSLWPWDASSFKPTPNDRVRELVKAGALIAAEIDRIQHISTDGNHKDASSLTTERVVDAVRKSAKEIDMPQDYAHALVDAFKRNLSNSKEGESNV